MKFIFQFDSRILQQRELSLNVWLRRWTDSKFRLLASLQSFLTFDFIKPQDTLRFLLRRRHFLNCSDPGGKSLQLHVHALIQNFDSCNLLPESSDVSPYLT
jgi:hypothetical protein